MWRTIINTGFGWRLVFIDFVDCGIEVYDPWSA